MIATLAGGLAIIGRLALATLGGTGRIAVFAARVISRVIRPPFHWHQLGVQLVQIGVLSLPMVGLTALFTGGALALQIYAGGARFSAEAAVPPIVAIGIVRELGPVLGGLMVAARVASSIAAELGTMKVTEQIDALVTLSTDPLKYLALPRVLAATIAVPLLVATGDSVGILGGYLVGTNRLGFGPEVYLRNTVDFLVWADVMSGLVKGAAFGFIVALMGCFFGMHSSGGARGVGHATKTAVVASAVLILAVNYLLTDFFFAT